VPSSGGRSGGARAAVVHDGGDPLEERLLVDLSDGQAARVHSPSLITDRSAHPRNMVVRRPSARAVSIIVLRGLPGRGCCRGRSTRVAHWHRGRSPDLQTVDAGPAESRRPSGNVRSAGSGQGANVGSAASQGVAVNMWCRTSSTGARPRDARHELRASPQMSSRRFCIHSPERTVVDRSVRRSLSPHR
jgi:hypothetical protein